MRRRSTAGDVGLDGARLESVVADVGLSSTVLSVLVVRGGQLVVEEYFNGAEASHAHNVFSTTKLLTTLAVGAAVDDGIVPGLDTTLGEWVEETAGSPAASITLEQLLSNRSGLAAEVNEPFSVEALAPLVAEPGSTYEYVTENFELVALGLDRRVAGGWCRYVHDRVLAPMAVSVDHWHESPYGNVTGGSYAFLAPRELARLGQLLLDDGRYEGEALVAGSLVGEMTEELTAFGCERGNVARSPRLIRSGAGLSVQLHTIAGHEVWASGGFGGQAIMVVPDLDLVVVITQEVSPVFERRLTTLDVLEYGVLPAVVDASSAPASPCPTGTLVRRDNDGTERSLASATGLLTDWAPDGARIAFGSDHDLNPELYVMDADGSNLSRLTSDGAADMIPRWSPDGTRIAFVSDRGAEHRAPLPELDLWLLDPVVARRAG